MCTNEGLPTAPATCTVEGTYDVTAEVKCPACAGAKAFSTITLTATVTGNEVKLLGDSTLYKCTLSGCTCTRSGGSQIIFTATGFTGIGKNSGSCEYETLEKGVRK